MVKISLQRKPIRKELAAIYRQEIIRDATLFTSQSAAKFYDRLFGSLDFSLLRAATGRRGFPKEAMVCAFIVMKCEGFAQSTDLNVHQGKAVIPWNGRNTKYPNKLLASNRICEAGLAMNKGGKTTDGHCAGPILQPRT